MAIKKVKDQTFMDTVNEAKSQHSMPSEVDTELVEPELTESEAMEPDTLETETPEVETAANEVETTVNEIEATETERHDASNYYPNDKRVNYKLTETNPHAAALNY